jgi:hypothetical protein
MDYEGDVDIESLTWEGYGYSVFIERILLRLEGSRVFKATHLPKLILEESSLSNPFRTVRIHAYEPKDGRFDGRKDFPSPGECRIVTVDHKKEPRKFKGAQLQSMLIQTRGVGIPGPRQHQGRSIVGSRVLMFAALIIRCIFIPGKTRGNRVALILPPIILPIIMGVLASIPLGKVGR